MKVMEKCLRLGQIFLEIFPEPHPSLFVVSHSIALFPILAYVGKPRDRPSPLQNANQSPKAIQSNQKMQNCGKIKQKNRSNMNKKSAPTFKQSIRSIVLV
jgi:hypothetical protein